MATVRLWVSAGRVEYAIWPDEPAQLAMARFLGGGVPWTMHDHSVWRPGYAALLAPVHLVTDDPVTVLRAAFALNAVLGGVAAWLLILLARRLTPLGPGESAVAAGVIALSPSALFPTEFVWSEALVVVLFLATLLVLLRFDEAPSTRSGLGAVVLAAAAFTTHSRMAPLAVVVVGVVVVAARRGRIGARSALGVAAIGAVAFGSGLVASRLVVERLWDDPASNNSVGAVAERLVHPGDVAISLTGQAWYALVSSLGLVGFGVWWSWRSVRRPGGASPDSTPTRSGSGSAPSSSSRRVDQASMTRSAATIVAVTVGSCVALSVVFMAGRMRPDQVVYGRYLDAVIGPVLLVGIGAVVTAVSARRLLLVGIGVVATTAVGAMVIARWRSAALSADNGIEPMILGLQPYVGDDVDVGGITGASMAITAVLVAILAIGARWPRTGRVPSRAAPLVVAIVIGGLLVVGGVRTGTILDRDWSSRGGFSEVVTVRDGTLPAGDAVEFVLPDGSDATNRLLLYQWYLPENRFTVVTDPADGTARYVFSDADDARLTTLGAELVWRDPKRPFGLWRRDS